MAIRTGWQYRVREFLRTQLAVRACGLLLNYIIVAGSAVDRVEPALVPALIGTDMAVETLGRAMYSGLKLSEVSFVAIDTGIRLLGVVGSRRERCAGEEECETKDELTHCDARCSRYFWC